MDREVYKRALNSSKLIVFGNAHINLLVHLSLAAVFDTLQWGGITFLLHCVYILSLNKVKDDQVRNNQLFLALVTSMFNVGVACVFFHRLSVMLDQNFLHPKHRKLVGEIHAALSTMTNPDFIHVHYPWFGSNSENALARQFSEIGTRIGVITGEVATFLRRITLIEHKVEAEWIRPLGISTTPIDITDRVRTRAEELRPLIERVRHLQKMIVGLAIVVMVLAILNNMLAVVVAIVAFLLNAIEVTKHTFIPSFGIKHKDGVYRVESLAFGVLPWSHGMGVSYGGVLHVPYHVNYGSPIHLGKSVIKPYYLSTEHDLVTYGGPPQLHKPKNGQIVYLNNENGETRTTYVTTADYDATEQILAWQGMTAPGDSGSPVFVKDTDENLVLVGLAGCYYRSPDGGQTEYTLGPFTTKTSGVPEEKIIQILMHPGSGKTRREIPRIIGERLAKHPKARIMITGPTRVVCREIYEALRRKGIDVGLNIRDTNVRSRAAMVQIATHHTAAAMLLKGSPETAGLRTLIIDEAHANDAATYVLRQYGRYLVEDPVRPDGKLYEMSATLDGKADRKTNYHVEDIKIRDHEIMKNLEIEMSEDRKVIVFVASTKGNLAQEIRKKYPRAVTLSRETYTNVAPLLDEPETRLIISTNIAECGINIKDLDTVLDVGSRYVYHLAGSAIIGEVRGISTASEVQRRGRVGRTKEGRYIRVDRAIEDNIDTAEMVDGQIAITGKEWAPVTTNPLGIYLTDVQLERMFEEMVTATEAYLRFTPTGIERTPEQISKQVRNLRSEQGSFYAGCGNCKRCADKWMWFDERIHDLLVPREINRPRIL